jgi:hypothetical protein
VYHLSEQPHLRAETFPCPLLICREASLLLQLLQTWRSDQLAPRGAKPRPPAALARQPGTRFHPVDSPQVPSVLKSRETSL